MAKTEKSIYYTEKELRDFYKLCQIHGFKNRKVIREETTGEVVAFHIYLPFVSGSQEKLLSNVARYTNSRKTLEPCMSGREKMSVRILLTRK